MDRTVAATGYVPGLDGLRAIAVAWVVGYHLQIPGTGLGWAGVPLFFVISGFLITRLLLSYRDLQHPYRVFFTRRVLRIFPVYYALLLIVSLVRVLVGDAQGLGRIPLYAVYVQNMIPELQARGDLLAHTWSLATEEQFYALWPLVVLRSSFSRLRAVILVMMVVGPLWRLGVWLTELQGQMAWAPLPGAVDFLASGAAIAVAISRGAIPARLRRWGLTAVLVGGVVVSGYLVVTGLGPDSPTFVSSWLRTHYVFNSALAAFFGGGVALVVGGAVPTILEIPAVRHVGKISYGIYAFHPPAIWFVGVLASAWFGEETSAFGSAVLVGAQLIATYAAAAVSWRFLEGPFLRLKERLAPVAW